MKLSQHLSELRDSFDRHRGTGVHLSAEAVVKMGCRLDQMADRALGLEHIRDTDTPREMVARLRTMAAEGQCLSDMAHAAGLSRVAVRRLCEEEGIAVPSHVVRMDRARAKGREAARIRASVCIPRWVPPDLRADYRDFAAEMGEEVAASRVRRLKAEARA